jgi:hypothetical protein
VGRVVWLYWAVEVGSVVEAAGAVAVAASMMTVLVEVAVKPPHRYD